MIKAPLMHLAAVEPQARYITFRTAQRMLGYLSHYRKLPMAEIVDEMLAILSDRNRIMQKHEWENTNAKWNEFLNQGFRKED